jgi:hypothetical protein
MASGLSSLTQHQHDQLALPLHSEARQALQATGYPCARGLTTGWAIMAA